MAVLYEYIKLKGDEVLEDLSEVDDPSKHVWLKCGEKTAQRVQACLDGATSAVCLTTDTGSSSMFFMLKKQTMYMLFGHYVTYKPMLLVRPVPTYYYELLVTDIGLHDFTFKVTNAFTGNELGSIISSRKNTVCGVMALIRWELKLSVNASIIFPALPAKLSSRCNMLATLEKTLGSDSQEHLQQNGSGNVQRTLKQFLKPKA